MLSKYVSEATISEIGTSVSSLLGVALVISGTDASVLFVSDNWEKKEILISEYVKCLIEAAGTGWNHTPACENLVVPITVNNVILGYGIAELKKDAAKGTDLKQLQGNLSNVLGTYFTSALYQTEGHLSAAKSEARKILRRFQTGVSTREEIYRDLLANACNFSSVDLAVIAAIDQETGGFRPEVFFGDLSLVTDFKCMERCLLGRWTLYDKQPVVVNDPQNDPRCSGTLHHDVKTVAVWPLFNRERPYGALYVISRSGTGLESWVQENIDFLSLQLSFMLGFEAKENENSDYSRKLKALMEISRMLNFSRDLGTLLNFVTDLSIKLFNVDTCCIYLKETPSSSMKLMTARGISPDEASLLENRFNQPERTVNSPDHDLVDFPIFNGDNEIGCLSMRGFREGPLRQEDRELMKAFAYVAGIAVNHSVMTEETKQTLLETVAVLCLAIEARDKTMLGHSEKVRDMGVALAQAMGLSAKEVELVESACLLHDIGKLGIPEALLNKPGSLTPQEYAEFKKHPVIGAEILSAVTSLGEVTTIVRHHHERFNGGGYPDGLRGQEIPLSARILAIADTFSSLISKRSYRSAKGPFEALEIIKANAGTHFDPDLVSIFEKVVRQRYTFEMELNPAGESKAKSQPGLEAREMGLTEREGEILAHIAAGMSNREIAEALYLSEKTVKTHVTHILKKLNLPDRTKAAVYAIQKGLVKYHKVGIRP